MRADGGPAFPRPASVDPTHGTLADGDDLVMAFDGMSLHDYFAAAALPGVIAATDMTTPGAWDIVANRCHGIAAAMIKHRT